MLGAHEGLKLKDMMMKKTSMMSLTAIAFVGASLSAGLVFAEAKDAKSPYTPDASQCVAVVKVDGMACGMNCPPRVSMALKGIKGVNKVRVNYESRRADVLATATTCEKKALEQFPKALKEAGYEGKVTKVIKGDKAS